MELNILYEDKDILVCEKLPGVPVQSDKTLAPDLVNQLKNYRFEKEETAPYIGLVHRLDRPVGGVMVFGKTAEATRKLSQQIQQKQMKKTYLCIVTKELPDLLGADKVLLTDYLKRMEGQIPLGSFHRVTRQGKSTALLSGKESGGGVFAGGSGIADRKTSSNTSANGGSCGWHFGRYKVQCTDREKWQRKRNCTLFEFYFHCTSENRKETYIFQ